MIEILMYVGIVMIIFTFSFLTVYQILDSRNRVKNQREVAETQKFIIQKMYWVLQNNSAINSPAASATSTSISVNKLSGVTNPLVVSWGSGNIYLKEGAGQQVALTNNIATSSNVIFTHYNFSGHDFIRLQAVVGNATASSTIDTTIFVK